MAKGIKGFIGARHPDGEPRWIRLLEAALEQPNPTPSLKRAIQDLRKRHRCRPYSEYGEKDDAVPQE